MKQQGVLLLPPEGDAYLLPGYLEHYVANTPLSTLQFKGTSFHQNSKILLTYYIAKINATKYTTKWGKKDSIEQNRSSKFAEKVQDYKDELLKC